MRAVINGGFMTPFGRRKDGSSYRDWVVHAFYMALQDCNIQADAIDAVIVASESDFFNGQLNPAALIADYLGVIALRTYRVEGGGATGHLAIHMGASLIMSKQAKCVAIIGYDSCASSLSPIDMNTLYNLSYDSWFEGQQDTSSTSIYALSALAYMQQTAMTKSDFASVAVRNHRYATYNDNAHLPLHITVQDVLESPVISTPYNRLDCSPLSDGACCVILSAQNFISSDRPPVVISGMAVANDFVRLGDRKNPAVFTAKQTAAKRAYNMADIFAQDISLIELYDSYSAVQLQSLDALGFGDTIALLEREGAFSLDNTFAVNISGGLLGQGAAVGAVGVAQFLTVYKLLTDTYTGIISGWHSPYGLVDTHGGVATNCAVSVVERLL